MASPANDNTSIPDLSILIVNWNTCTELRGCLSSLGEVNPGETEVIVIENASSDDSVEMLRREFPWVHVIENEENLGFAKAANQGILASHGRYVLFLNPDAEIAEGSLRALTAFGDDNPTVGIIGPKILNSDGSLQYSCRQFPTLQAGIFRNSILGRFFPRNPYTRDYLMTGWNHAETKDVDWVSGAAMLARRELLEDIGCFDERFFMYCEDVDLAYRARQERWRVVYFPEVAIVHARAKSSDQEPNRMIVEFHKSMHRFFKKHYARKSSVFARIVVPIGLLARATFFVGRNNYYHLLWRLRKKTRRGSGEVSGQDEPADKGRVES